jgi:hypothetical protein
MSSSEFKIQLSPREFAGVSSEFTGVQMNSGESKRVQVISGESK